VPRTGLLAGTRFSVRFGRNGMEYTTLLLKAEKFRYLWTNFRLKKKKKKKSLDAKKERRFQVLMSEMRGEE
jgi:hypothetical protein